MSQPTIYVDIDSRYPTNPMTVVVKQLASAFGATPVDKIVSADEMEATIAVTDSVAKAFRMIKETERTAIVIAYFYRRDGVEIDAFAGRYPDRVRSINYMGFGEKDEMSFAPFLKKLIADKARGMVDGND